MPPRIQLEKDTWQIQQGIMLGGLCIPSGLGTPLDPPGGPGTRCKEEGGPDCPLWALPDGRAENGGWMRNFQEPIRYLIQKSLSDDFCSPAFRI